MILSVASAPSALERQARQFFQETAGQWQSQRRYYYLTTGMVQTGLTELTIDFLTPSSPDLQQLAQGHHLRLDQPFFCGVKVAWESRDGETQQLTNGGQCIFGLRENQLYRDRGFATLKPLVAQYQMPQPRIFAFCTRYDGAEFEEECRLIEQSYRTRHLVAYRGREAQMIAQYFETRIF